MARFWHNWNKPNLGNIRKDNYDDDYEYDYHDDKEDWLLQKLLKHKNNQSSV
jgi:hypothetical protein